MVGKIFYIENKVHDKQEKGKLSWIIYHIPLLLHTHTLYFFLLHNWSHHFTFTNYHADGVIIATMGCTYKLKIVPQTFPREMITYRERSTVIALSGFLHCTFLQSSDSSKGGQSLWNCHQRKKRKILLKPHILSRSYCKITNLSQYTKFL